MSPVLQEETLPMNKSAVTKPKLSLSETREFLAQVAKHPQLVEAAGEFLLDDREVARFITRKAKTLYLIASYSKLPNLEKSAEALFISAFDSACANRINSADKMFDLESH
jgi:hypothetical protein